MKRFLRVAFLAAILNFAFVGPALSMPFLIPFIPLAIAVGGWAAGAITGVALLVTLATTALSFVAQSLLKPAASQAQTQLSGSVSASSVSIDQKQTIRQATAARKVVYGTTRIGGTYGVLQVTDNNSFLRGAILYVGHQCNSIPTIMINDEVVTLDGNGIVTGGTYDGAAYFTKHLGAPDQVAASALVNNVAGWTVNHRLRGITYLDFWLLWDNLGGDGTVGINLWSGGLPNITIIPEGKLVYDPRTGLTAYSNNSALCVADYLCDPLYGLGVDYATGINEDALIAAANACDELVSLAAGGTEKRYTTDGVFQSDSKPDEILGRLLAAMQGKAIYDGDRWTIYAGVYQTPTITITDDDMRGPSQIQTLGSARDSFNGVKGTYCGPDNKWSAADFPPVVSAAYKAMDGGLEQLKDIELPFTISAGRAQRIAKIDLIRGRQEIVENFRGKLTCWPVRTGDTILRTSTRYGWVGKPFEVGAMTFVSEEDADGNPVIGIDMTLQEATSVAYDWTADEESTVDPAPNTNFPAIFGVLPASNLRVSEDLYSSRNGGGVKALFTLEWDASADSFVGNGGQYRPRYRRQGFDVWTPLADTKELLSIAFDIEPGLYEAELRAVNWAGNPSEAIYIAFEVIGTAAAPAAPSNFTVSAHDSLAYANYDKSPDLDVLEGGFLVVKHSAALTGATWEESLFMAEDISGNLNRVALPLVAGTYLAKFKDSTGHYSEDFAAFVQFQSSVHTFTLLGGGSSVQDPDFAGVKNDCVNDAGVLKLAGVDDFDDVPDVDALTAFDYPGGVIAAGTYDYDATMDLGSVKRCRLTNAVEAFIQNVFESFDDRTADSDTWLAWDGEILGDEADSWLTVRWTLDNPVGSPTWSEWERLHASSFEARAFQFRRHLVSSDASFTPAIFADAVVAEGV